MRAENELQQLLDAVANESGSKIERRTDEFGFEWLIVRDPDFEDLVTTVHLIASELESRGFGPQLLAAVFPFEGNERSRGRQAGVLDLRLQAGRVLAVRAHRRGARSATTPRSSS